MEKEEQGDKLSVGSILHEAKLFLKFKKAENVKILFVMVTGSQAYNLTTVKSDYDYLGVFLAPTTDTLLINPPHWDWSISTVPGEEVPDFTFHEAKSMGTYLLKGNPFAMEALFSHKHLYESKAWRKLKKNRKNFLTKQAIEEFLSYSTNMLDKKGKKNLPNKRIYHVVRLFFEALRMIDGQEPTIEMFGEEKEFLLKLKTDQLSNEEFEIKVKELRDKIESLRPWPKLPQRADETIVDNWLKEIRSQDLRHQNWDPDDLE